MDKTAIEAIQALAHAEQINKIIADTDLFTLALPNGYHMEDMEKFCNQPYRFRGHYITHLIDEFTAYLNANGSQSTGIFVDSRKSTAHAVIDMGDCHVPQWGAHKASITLKHTPEFAALSANKDKDFDQLAFIDWVEDWPECFTFLGGSEDDSIIPLPTAIAAIRKLTLKQASDKTMEAGDFNAAISQFDQIEVNANGAPLPKGFIFTCIPYEGLSEIRFECRLRAMTNDKKVKLKYRIMAYDRILDDIAVEFKDTLKAKITAPGASFYCGEMAYQK